MVCCTSKRDFLFRLRIYLEANTRVQEKRWLTTFLRNRLLIGQLLEGRGHVVKSHAQPPQLSQHEKIFGYINLTLLIIYDLEDKPTRK